VTARENTLAQLANLLEQGSMPASVCGGSFLRMLRPVLDASVVVEERSGAGRRLVVRDAAALREFTQRHFPDVSIPEDSSSRVAGVARFRDSKALVCDTPEILTVRAWSEGVLLRDGKPTEAVSATARHGVFSFLLGELSAYSVRGTCALVENPAVFTHLDQLRLPVGLAIYGHGRSSARLVEWLAGMTAPNFRLLHLPDYDPVGLAEFQRLRKRLESRAHLHLPSDLAHRFAHFSNRGLLTKHNNQAILATLRQSDVPEILQIVALIDRHNAGLEQEALLLSLP
jgi:hypothetical protein